MRDLLQRIRSRVDRLAAGEALRTCDGQHAVVKVSYVPLGASVPDWPPASAPDSCVCGAELEYRHLVMQQQPD
jgi:hypothetical protein